MTVFSCKECTERTAHCHSTCEKYLKEKKAHEEYMEKVRQSKTSAITGYDLSVISRATAGKYVATAQGVYPLKLFFNERPKDDEDTSFHEIQAVLKEIIDGENKKKPLSDEAITAELVNRGYDIARRTVAKYRERMGLPVARLRKQL